LKGSFGWRGAGMDLAQEAPANLRCPKNKDNVFVYV